MNRIRTVAMSTAAVILRATTLEFRAADAHPTDMFKRSTHCDVIVPELQA